MIFKSNYFKRREYKENWHNWFAWYPVIIYENKKTKKRYWAWLEIVKRKGELKGFDGAMWFYEYSTKNDQEIDE
jgi:hypothetical protein